jgi:hypothetical protein
MLIAILSVYRHFTAEPVVPPAGDSVRHSRGVVVG